MMLKVNDEYLDFNTDIHMSKSAKLIEAISETTGDFSYSFSIPKTSKNIQALGLQTINKANKIAGSKIPAQIESFGNVIHDGYLSVTRFIGSDIECDFFSGNTNWFTQITGTLYDIDLSSYDNANNIASIVSSWANDSGVVYPVVDKGIVNTSLTNRFVKNDTTRFEFNDFHPFIYVKTLFKRIGETYNLKFDGELLSDPVFNKLIVTSNPSKVSTDRVNASTSLVGRTSSQVIGTTQTKAMLIDTDPFLDGDNDNWDNTLSRYTADQDMFVSLTFNLNFSIVQQYVLEIYKNGSLLSTLYIPKSTSVVGFNLSSGNYLEFYLTASGSPANLLTDSSIEIKPTFFKTVYMSDYLPNMNTVDFINTVFAMFNVVTSFDKFSKTVNTALFKNIRHKEEIDLSQYVSSYDVDYKIILDSFYRHNILKYESQELDQVEKYNASNPVPLGAGDIEIDSDIVEETGNIVELQAIAPYSYYNEAFKMWMMRLNYFTSERGDTEREITSVTNSGGVARFNYTGSAVGIGIGTVVEIYNTDDDYYEGSGIVSSLNPGWIELEGVEFIADQTGFFVVSNYTPIESDLPIFAINCPNLPVSDFSSNSSFYINGTAYTTASYAYFYKPELNLPIDREIFSLSFGRGSEIKDYQIPLAERYYSDLGIILNDAQQVNLYANLPFKVYNSIDFLRPIRVKTVDFNSLFYGNKIMDYSDSSKTCLIELVKLM